MANLTNSAKLIEEMEKKINASAVGKAGKTNDFNDLDNKPDIPTVNNSTITIQKNGANVDSFTTNAASAKTINIQLTKADVDLGNVDNTSDANKPISNATQTALNAKANANDVYTKAEVDAKVSSVYRYKGSKTTYSELPSSGNTTGDVWNVTDTNMNYAWDGSAWDPLAGTVDLTNYFNKSTDTSDNITQGSSKLFVSSTEKNTWNGKQNALSTAQLNAVNSGITSSKVSTYDGYATTIAGKQDALSTTQLNAVNSGITSSKVSTYDGYATTIGNKANTSDVLTKTNTTAYTPTADYHPATKKYVDDNAGSAIVYLTQSEYDALPSTKLTDGKSYVIIEGGV